MVALGARSADGRRDGASGLVSGLVGLAWSGKPGSSGGLSVVAAVVGALVGGGACWRGLRIEEMELRRLGREMSRVGLRGGWGSGREKLGRRVLVGEVGGFEEWVWMLRGGWRWSGCRCWS